MKALVYTGTESLDYRAMSQPVPNEGEHLVRIAASGICGSDMHAYLGHDDRRPAPLVLGHEAAGTVVGGPDDERRVTINPLVSCGTCVSCRTGRTNICLNRQIISMPPRQGAFADFVAMPSANLVTVPDHVPMTKAALAEPLACGWHGIRLAEETISKPMRSARCLVIGGGAIGVGAALALRAFGVEDLTVIEPNGVRREHLAAYVDFRCMAPDDRALPTLGSADIVVDAVG